MKAFRRRESWLRLSEQCPPRVAAAIRDDQVGDFLDLEEGRAGAVARVGRACRFGFGHLRSVPQAAEHALRICCGSRLFDWGGAEREPLHGVVFASARAMPLGPKGSPPHPMRRLRPASKSGPFSRGALACCARKGPGRAAPSETRKIHLL